MKLVLSLLILGVATAFGKKLADELTKKSDFYKDYADFLSDLAFAVSVSKETVGEIKKRHESVFEKIDALTPTERERAERFLSSCGKSSAAEEKKRIEEERRRLMIESGEYMKKVGERKKCAVLIPLATGIIVVLVII